MRDILRLYRYTRGDRLTLVVGLAGQGIDATDLATLAMMSTWFVLTMPDVQKLYLIAVDKEVGTC